MQLTATIDKPELVQQCLVMALLKLDQRDLQILTTLSRHGRMSKTELAKQVNLSATPCWDRLNRLETAGIISGYHADIELRRIAPHVSVFVMAELENHRASTFQSFELAISSCEEVTDCWALGGGFDYLFRVVTRDIDCYQRLIDDLLAQRVGLTRYFSYIVTKPVKQGAIPPLSRLVENAFGQD